MTHSKSTTPLVSARGLTKTFNGRPAVDNIDFDIYTGEVVGFLGPNGAGKTTTIRMLLNILNPTHGELTLFGTTFHQERNRILSQMNSSSGVLTLPGKLSVWQNLKVFSDMYGIKKARHRIDTLIEKLDLEGFRDRPLYSLSTGQQVRVSLAKAFLNKPKLLLLDEPTASLDPDVADRVRSFISQHVKEEGTTVFLTSHNMAEVEKVCSRVLFLNEGRIQAEGSPRELARRIKRWRVTVKIKKEHDEIVSEIDRDKVGPYLTDLVKAGKEIENVSIHEPTLEDFFVQTSRGKVSD